MQESITNKIIEYLKTHPFAKPTEIANALGISVKLVRIVLTKLKNRGIVVRTQRGYIVRPSTETKESRDISEEIKAMESSESTLREPYLVTKEEEIHEKQLRPVEVNRQIQQSRETMSIPTDLVDAITRLNEVSNSFRNLIEDLKNIVMELRRTRETQISSTFNLYEFIDYLLDIFGYIDQYDIERLSRAISISSSEILDVLNRSRSIVKIGRFYIHRNALDRLRETLSVVENIDELDPRELSLAIILQREGYLYRDVNGKLKLVL